MIQNLNSVKFILSLYSCEELSYFSYFKVLPKQNFATDNFNMNLINNIKCQTQIMVYLRFVPPYDIPPLSPYFD